MLRAFFLVQVGFVLGALAAESPSATITVTSAAFSNGGKIPDRFTCKGADESPMLQFHGIPGSAKSLVLIVDDPDAPSGLFTHWLVWNIDPSMTEIAEKNVPTGAVQGTNDFGKIGYGGPCPPSGTHRYFFRVSSLDQKLNLKSGAKRSELDKAMQGHIVARGELMARYSH
jgi:Raf kinase inhibitor-like YbhB/YbcL family protein